MGLKFRRGTTAQKSGSLAFGEPYVNTDLGTLQIGGAAGDITLGASGTGSAGIFSAISGSGLDISGDANIHGDLTIGGKIQIGDNSSDTVNVVASLSSSLIPSLDNTFDLGDVDHIWRDLYISTGSIKMVSNGVVVSTLSNTGNGMTLDQGLAAGGDIVTKANILATGSISSSTVVGMGNVTDFSSSIATSFSASVAAQTTLSSSTAAALYDTIYWPTTGLSASLSSGSQYQVNIFSASINDAIFGLNPNALSYSFSSSLGALSGSVSSSIADLSSSVSTSIYNNLYSNVNSVSYSFASASAAYSSSVSESIYQNIWSNASSLSASVAMAQSTYSSSTYSTFAKLDASNVFTGTQVVTGSVYVSGDFIVQGTSSLQNITASAVSIGTNIVQLNTATPAVRFGGLSVIDSGSTGVSGSLFWDSENNNWVYQKQSGSTYSGGMLISGPRNTGSLGDEIGLTKGQLAVSLGGDHIGDSIISASATQVYVSGSLKIVDATSELQIVGNEFGQASLISPNGALVLTPGLYGVQVNGAYPDLSVNGTISGSITGIGNVTVYSTSVDSRIATNVNSAAGAFASASAYSASAATTYAKLGVQNTFTATQIISGSLIVNSNIKTNYIVNDSGDLYVGPFADIVLSGDSGYTRVQNNDLQVTGSINVTSAISASSINGIGNVTTYSTSVDSRIATAQNSAAGAFASASAYSGSFYTTVNTVIGTVTTAQNTGAGAFASASAYSASAATTYAKLGVANTFTANQIVSGSITATGDVVAYSTSDKRHKNNIVNITDALAKVTKLNGVTWEWNDDVDSATKETPKTGLIAQEVQEVLPEVVKERQDGFLALDYSKMMGLMVEAIKEQQTQIAELKAEIEALKK